MPDINTRAAAALREAAQNLRDPSRVVLDYRNYVTDAEGHTLAVVNQAGANCRACALGHIDLASRGDWRAEDAAVDAAEGVLPEAAHEDDHWDALTVTLRDHGPERVAEAFEAAAAGLEGTDA
jgi:hypothetical protein